MNEYLVSIIIPVYNCGKYIKKTIASVKKQSYTNWELIVVNDGSTDESLNVIKDGIKDIKGKSTLINLEKNHGVAIARNTALENAKGDFIAYLDADDMWEKEKLKKQLDFMKKNNIIFSYTSYSRISEDEKFLKVVKAPNVTTYKDLLKNTIMLTSTIIIDVRYIDKKMLQMPNLTISEDTQTWLNILKTGIRAYGLDENLAEYRQRRGSASSNKIKSTIGIWKVYRKYQLMGRIKSSYYTLLHIVYAIKKRLLLIDNIRKFTKNILEK